MTLFWTALVFLTYVLGAVSVVHALLSVRTPQGTIAWIVSLIALPVIAVPSYWVLGRSRFNGYVLARKAKDSGFAELQQEVAERIRRFQSAEHDGRGGVLAAERLARMPFTGRNRVELLIDGDATFGSILDGIREAREYILIQFYIVRNDNLGRRLADALRAKADEGVPVYFLYDEIGSQSLDAAYGKELERSGIRFQPFHSTRGMWNRFQLNFRNHRKIVVVDGRSGWVGGHNVGNEYLGITKKFGPWRDTHVRVTGPAALGLQVSFFEDWHWATGEELDLPWEPVAAHGDDTQVLILPTGPADSVESASLLFQHAIHSATRRIWIASPYFVPDEAVLGALKIAQFRGVDVRILIPDRPDHILVYLSAYAFLGAMLQAGVRVYRYQPGFLHQKVFLVDDVAAGVGTANLDNRSFRLNFEVTALVSDPDFAAEVEGMLERDFEQSRPMTLEELDEKPMWFRAAARAAYLTAPIL